MIVLCDLYTLIHLYSAEHTAATAAAGTAPPQQGAYINGKAADTTVDNSAPLTATSPVTSSAVVLLPGAIVLQHSSFHWGSGGEGSNVHGASNGSVTATGSNCWSCCGGSSKRPSSAAVTAPPQGNICSHTQVSLFLATICVTDTGTVRK
jgi:hypothetical protein